MAAPRGLPGTPQRVGGDEVFGDAYELDRVRHDDALEADDEARDEGERASGGRGTARAEHDEPRGEQPVLDPDDVPPDLSDDYEPDFDTDSSDDS